MSNELQLSEIQIAHCGGSNSGSAIYLGIKDRWSTRVAGGKCWGLIKDIRAWTLEDTDLDNIIKVCQEIKGYKRREIEEFNEKQRVTIDTEYKQYLENGVLDNICPKPALNL